MHKFIWSLMVIGLVAGQTYSAAPEQAPGPVSDKAIQAYRNDVQGGRADIIAKNVALTADQAAKFWPEYAKFQQEQTTIVDAQLKSIQQYVASFATLDDAAALALVNALLTRDDQMQQLRARWLIEFQNILPARLAARVIQIDRRLGLAHQMQMSSELPLIY
jgi:hypothetical protein